MIWLGWRMNGICHCMHLRTPCTFLQGVTMMQVHVFIDGLGDFPSANKMLFNAVAQKKKKKIKRKLKPDAEYSCICLYYMYVIFNVIHMACKWVKSYAQGDCVNKTLFLIIYLDLHANADLLFLLFLFFFFFFLFFFFLIWPPVR